MRAMQAPWGNPTPIIVTANVYLDERNWSWVAAEREGAVRAFREAGAGRRLVAISSGAPDSIRRALRPFVIDRIDA